MKLIQIIKCFFTPSKRKTENPFQGLSEAVYEKTSRQDVLDYFGHNNLTHEASIMFAERTGRTIHEFNDLGSSEINMWKDRVISHKMKHGICGSDSYDRCERIAKTH